MPPTYGSGWGSNPFEDLTLPSGAICQARKLQIEDMVALGIMDDLDFLGNVVQDEHVDRVKRPQDHAKKKLTKAQQAKAQDDQTKKLLTDKKTFSKMAAIVDDVCCAVVVQPTVLRAVTVAEDGTRTPIPAQDRQEGAIYSDTIGFEDKMAIFNFSFSGMEKMAKFREGSESPVADLDAEQGSEVQAE
jgi:hypothetical protein